MPLMLLATLAGCVERKLTIRTVPDGATVVLNDQEVGKSPVTVPFTWYGDYDVVCRKERFAAERTHVKLDAPWYELPVVDLFSECLVPVTIRDYRERTIELRPESVPSAAELLQRAGEMRDRALAPDGAGPAVRGAASQPGS